MNSIERAMERFQEMNTAYKQDGAIAPSIANNKTSVVQFVPDSKPNFQLDFKSLARKGYLTPNTTYSDMAEAYRILKRPVLMNVKSNDSIQAKHSNLILITSALPGEGKTFTAFNLAMSIAFERDSTVLLVDTDVTKHSLTNLIGLNNSLGLTDVLLDAEINLADIIVGTNIQKLKFIPAGRPHSEATELLASERMHTIACELSARYSDRIVLFDAPPLLPTSQAVVLATLMGQILVVVEEGKNSKAIIQEAVSLLDEDKVICMVLNRCHRLLGNKRYGDYY